MSLWLHSIVLINHKSKKQTQGVYGKLLVVCCLLLFAILIGAALAYGQTAISSLEDPLNEETAVTDGDSTAFFIDSTQAVELDRKTVSFSRESQISSRQPNLRREKPFTYISGGRRDAFKPLISDAKGDEKVETDLLCVDGAVLTGVVWSSGEYLAMVRNKEGKNFFLREGDAVFRGTVTTVTQTKVVFRLVEFGEVETVTLTVRSNEGNK